MDSAILLFLSKYKPADPKHPESKNAAKVKKYTASIPGEGQTRFSGLQTNDAPCKYLMRKAAADGHPISTILCLVSMADLQTIADPETIPRPGQLTKADLEKNPDAKNNTFTFFEKVICRYADRIDGLPRPEIIMIPYDCDPSAPNFDPDCRDKKLRDALMLDIDQRPTQVYSRIAQCISQRGLRHLYVDFTGGMRDTAFLLMELSRFLRFIGISCEEIVYSNFEDRRIISLRPAYSMFPILSGIDEFLNTGNARRLQEAYQGRQEEPIVDKLLSSLTSFAQAISLCSLDNIDSIYMDIVGSVRALEQYEVTPQSDITLVMLKDFVPKIREKFHISTDSQKPSYLGLIQWCLSNDLLQQALTLYVEKVPVYCFDTGLLKDSIAGNVSVQKHKTEAVSAINDIYTSLAADENLIEFVNCLKFASNKYKNCDINFKTKDFLQATNGRPRSNICTIALARFKTAVSSNFDTSTGKAKDKGDGAVFSIYNNEYSYNKFSSFLAASMNQKNIQHFFVYKNEKQYKKDTDSVETKKTALGRLNSGAKIFTYTKHLDQKQLHDLLLHYFAITSIRNCVNHAAESASHGNASLTYCVQEGILASSDLSYTVIRNALENAVNYMFDLEKQVFPKKAAAAN